MAVEIIDVCIYTVKCRDVIAGSHWCFIDQNLNVTHTPLGVKPLTLSEARKARRLLIDGAKKYGRLIECKVTRLDRLTA